MNVRGAALAAGVVAAPSAAVSLAVLAVDGNGHLGGAFTHGLTVYGRSQALIAGLLLLAGLCSLVARRPSIVAGLLGLVVLFGTGLAGVGTVGYRRWPLYWGCCSPQNLYEGELVRDLAAAMAIVGAVSAVVGLVVLIAGGLVRSNPVSTAVAIPVALVVAIAAPRMMVGGWEDERELVAWAVMYSLPIGVIFVLSSLLERPAALVVVAAAVGYALIATAGEPFIYFSQRRGDEIWATTTVVVACLAVGATRMIPQRRSP